MKGKSVGVHLLFLVLLLLAGPATAGEEPPKLSVEDLVRQGVALHDEGQLDEAVRRYKQALEREPDNSLALYELAHTYSALQRYDLCNEAAQRGLKKAGALEGALFTVWGICLSSAGKTAEALRTFEEGLAKHPDDPGLHLNLAVTLLSEGKLEKARPHLQRAVEIKPFHSTPYYGLGGIAAETGRASEGIFYYMRFVSLERNSKRAADASKKVFDLLASGVSAEGEKDVRITLDPDGGEAGGELAALELARTLAAATIHLDEARAQSPAQRSVAALDNFLKIAQELSQGEGRDKMVRSFAWERAARPVFQLQKRGLLECFEYLLAARARLEGAEEWLAKNPRKVEELEAALAGNVDGRRSVSDRQQPPEE